MLRRELGKCWLLCLLTVGLTLLPGLTRAASAVCCRVWEDGDVPYLIVTVVCRCKPLNFPVTVQWIAEDRQHSDNVPNIATCAECPNDDYHTCAECSGKYYTERYREITMTQTSFPPCPFANIKNCDKPPSGSMSPPLGTGTSWWYRAHEAHVCTGPDCCVIQP